MILLTKETKSVKMIMRRNLIFSGKVYFWVEVYLFALHKSLLENSIVVASRQSRKTLLSVLSVLQAALFILLKKEKEL